MIDMDADIRRILEATRTIAVLGAHVEPVRPAHYVPEYLYHQGYRILAVNPAFVGRRLFDEPVRETLKELAEPIDLVDVFRRPEALPAHLEDLLAMRPLPKVVWFQLGIRNDDVAARLRAVGIEVVQDRCTLADHRRLRLAPRTPA